MRFHLWPVFDSCTVRGKVRFAYSYEYVQKEEGDKFLQNEHIYKYFVIYLYRCVVHSKLESDILIVDR